MPSVVMPIILQPKEIGKIFDMDYTAVSQGVRRFENSIKEDDKIRKKLESVLELLNSNECQM
jgi:chromosomal replication initiation ATPase DnaA